MITGYPFMSFEQPGEIFALHRQQLLECLVPRLFILCQNHGLHVRNTIGREEHMFGAAQPDALRAELASRLGVARNVGIGAHAEIATKVSAHFMNSTKSE